MLIQKKINAIELSTNKLFNYITTKNYEYKKPNKLNFYY